MNRHDQVFLRGAFYRVCLSDECGWKEPADALVMGTCPLCGGRTGIGSQCATEEEAKAEGERMLELMEATRGRR